MILKEIKDNLKFTRIKKEKKFEKLLMNQDNYLGV